MPSFLYKTQWNMINVLGKRKKCMLTILITCTFIYWLLNMKNVQNLKQHVLVEPCDDNETKGVISQICHLYKAKEIVGDLCAPLCENNLVTYTKCLNYKYSKYIIQVQCRHLCNTQQIVPAVLKMKRINGSNVNDYLVYSGLDLLALLSKRSSIASYNLQEYIITSRNLSILTADLLKNEYGFFAREGQDILSLLWGDDYADYFKGTKTNLLFARSYWSAVKQNELRISRIFDDWDVFPEVYGTCGPLYITEHNPSLKSLDKYFSFLRAEFPPWNQRAKLAIEILHFVQKTDAMEHSLHLCDIKSPHFGFTVGNTVKFIDAETVLADEAFNRDMSALKCNAHKDCAIFDCEGLCDFNTHRCLPMRINNNLQTVCNKVFRGTIFSSVGGLLYSPPHKFAEKIISLINHCADMEQKEGKVVLKKPGQEILSDLKQILMESIDGQH
ncbi:divergent protein kinase domain 1C-like [Physella acuta]|uniref:divergent protein kinase domain 1C-like n=1 Tax=Physella acuta TaxID=109671 RepID=UPI0027DB2B40|nr:divergent protein kinase domain 1C-like [Physella acuta]